MKKLLFAALMALVLAGIGGTVATPADAGLIIPQQEADYGQLGANWWKWALSIPYKQDTIYNPIFDTTGASCALRQKGGMWFLAGTNGNQVNPETGEVSPVTRSCTIPRGKTIFFPIVTYNNTYPCPDPSFQPAPGQSLKDFLTNGIHTQTQDVMGAKDVIDTAKDLHASLDDMNLLAGADLSHFRGTSNLYSFAGDPTLTATLDPCITGSQQKAVSDGYWLLLAPLSAGSHTLEFKGITALGTVWVIYHLTVEQ